MNEDFEKILNLIVDSEKSELPSHILPNDQKKAIITIAYEVIQVLACLRRDVAAKKKIHNIDIHHLHSWVTYWVDYWVDKNEVVLHSSSIIRRMPTVIIRISKKIISFALYLPLSIRGFNGEGNNYLRCYSVTQAGFLEEVKFILRCSYVSPPPIFFQIFLYLKARIYFTKFKAEKFQMIRNNFERKLSKYLERILTEGERDIIKFFPFEYIHATYVKSSRTLDYISDGDYSSSLLTRMLLATKNSELFAYQHGNNYLMRNKISNNIYESAIKAKVIGWGVKKTPIRYRNNDVDLWTGALRILPELKKEIVLKNISLTIYGCDSSDTFVESWREKSIRREIAMAKFIDKCSLNANLEDNNVFIQYKPHPWDRVAKPHLEKFYNKYDHKISFGGAKEGLVAASLYDSTICWLRLALNRPTIFIFDDYEDVTSEYRAMIGKLFELEICFSHESALFKKLDHILINQNKYINHFLSLDIPKIISPYIVRYS